MINSKLLKKGQSVKYITLNRENCKLPPPLSRPASHMKPTLLLYLGFLPGLLIPFLLPSCGNNISLKEVTRLEQYPSASGIEFIHNRYYITGDDANYLLVLDTNFVAADSMALYAFPEKRIPKKIKADLESACYTRDNKLFLAGSGSLSPYRNTGWLIDPLTKTKDSIRLDTLYARFLQNGIKELNLEGCASVPGYLLFSNRGSKGNPENHLIWVKDNFWQNQSNSPLFVNRAGSGDDTALFSGISGLAYSKRSDRLLLTISTEDTRNSLDDGAIGKSYLWIIDNITTKRGWKAINPNKVIELDAIDPRFKGQKIESVCIVKETGQFFHLVLAADNDDGSSTLFKLIVEKN